MKERATTTGRYDNPSDGRAWASHPEAPKGDGWRMTGAAAANGLLFWFWERETPPVPNRDSGGT
jgi:hypothetical protein